MTQNEMAKQTVILVDEKDNFLGYAPRSVAHTGKGKRHRAFVTLLFDSQNRVILHKRKHKLFDSLWDLTAISHPLHINQGYDEDYQEASDRALKKEMGIGNVKVSKIGAFNYFAKDGKNCEREYCAILLGNYDGAVKLNKNEVYEIKKVKFDDFLGDISKDPDKYTPWARLTALRLTSFAQGKLFKEKGLRPDLFALELKSFLKVFEPYYKKYFDRKIKQASKYSPLISQFYRDLADFSSGGKRMRGFLVFLGYRIASSKFKVQSSKLEKVLPICLAVELAHSFLLIHDDIIDKSDIRHGKPTIHRRYAKDFGQHYGESQAIVLGDIACFEALKLVNESTFSDKQRIDVSKKLLEVLLETGYGEALDVKYSNKRGRVSDIWQIADLKTARYSFVGPLLLGGILGEASAEQLNFLERYGLLIGKAFQLQDDILGVFGDEKILGKSTLSDMREGKNTILIYRVKEMGNLLQKARISELWGSKDGGMREIGEIRDIVKSSGALAWCEQENERLVGQAKRYIGKITTSGQLRQIFGEMADFVVSRQK